MAAIILFPLERIDYTKNMHEKINQGLVLFNNRAFYEAHELFEDAWRDTPDPSREFYRALLHMSGGFYRLTQYRTSAAKKFFSHAIKWLNQYPEIYQEFDILVLRRNAQKMVDLIDQRIDADTILNNHFMPIHPLTPEEPE